MRRMIGDRPLTRSRRRFGSAGALAACLVIVASLTACTDGDPDAEDLVAPDTSPITDEPASEEHADDDAGGEPIDGDDADVVPTEPGPPRVALPDVAPLQVRTSGAGLGPWPTLAWEPVDAAVRYRVTVYTEADRAWWAWTGPENEVILGGFTTQPSSTSQVAPRLDGPMTYDVVALDADDRVVAQSGVVAIAP